MRKVKEHISTSIIAGLLLVVSVFLFSGYNHASASANLEKVRLEWVVSEQFFQISAHEDIDLSAQISITNAVHSFDLKSSESSYCIPKSEFVTIQRRQLFADFSSEVYASKVNFIHTSSYPG